MAIFTSSFLTDFLAIILILLTVIVIFIKRCFTHWKLRGVYTFPPSIPFGNAAGLAFQKTFLGLQFKELYDKLKEKNLKYGGYYFFTKPIFVPIELDLIKRIMTQDFSHFMDHVLYANEELEPLTAHLFALKGYKWKRLRSKLTPSFSSGKMKMMFPIMVNCGDDLIDVVNGVVERGESVEIKDLMGRFTTDVIGNCAFGLECSSLKDPNSEFRTYGKKYFNTSLRDSIIRLMMFLCPEVISYFKIRTLREDVYNFFMNVVTQTVAYREENKITRNDFMHLLIQLKNDVGITDELEENGSTNGTITLNELAAQCLVFFLAGFETSSTTLNFLFYEIVQHPEIQDKIRQEINEVLAKYQGKITYDAIMEMTYLDKCINETMRKYPPIPIHMRECNRSYKVPDSNLILEKGSFVFIPVWGIQRDPDYYPDPEKFDPERFSEENKAKRHPSMWMPFGDGPRTCIGLRFGLLQTKMGVLAMIKNFKFTLNPKTNIPLVMDPRVPMILTVKDGVWIDAQKIG